MHVTFLKGGPNLPLLESRGVVLHRLRSWGNHDPGIFHQLVGLIRRIRPDIIQTWILQMDVLAGIAAIVTGTPWILREPCSAEAYPRTIKNELRHWIGGRASAIVANSKAGESYWRTQRKPQVCNVIPNCIPLTAIESAPPAPIWDIGISPGQKLVLYVGRFEEQKNVESLVEALSLVPEEERVAAILAGDGTTRPAILRKIDRLGISDRVALPGFVADASGMMKRADAFVYLSLYDGFPNVVLEAMACGCPLVVSDISAHRDFLDEQCALFVSPRQPADVAEAIRRTLLAPVEAQARAKIAKERVTRWSVAWVARQYEEAYQEVLERRLCRK